MLKMNLDIQYKTLLFLVFYIRHYYRDSLYSNGIGVSIYNKGDKWSPPTFCWFFNNKYGEWCYIGLFMPPLFKKGFLIVNI